MTMLTVMTMFLIYPFTLSHEHRHHRHAYSEMTLAVYYCSKQKQWYYEKRKIRMTQMTLMTLNLGYGIGISSKQRHKRHQRHYRHTRAARGSGGHPRNAFVDIQTLCLQNMSTPKTVTIKLDAHTNPYIPQSESLLIHPKILTRKSESVLIHFPKCCYYSPSSTRVVITAMLFFPGTG